MEELSSGTQGTGSTFPPSLCAWGIHTTHVLVVTLSHAMRKCMELSRCPADRSFHLPSCNESGAGRGSASREWRTLAHRSRNGGIITRIDGDGALVKDWLH